MATRSSISFMNQDGQVQLIYCHSDGYLSYNGLMLFLHYQDKEKIKKMIELGDMSSLNEQVEPPAGVKHSFENRDELTTVFYGRDRGEDNIDARSYKDLEDYAQHGDFQEYDYLYQEKNNTWYLFNTSTSKLQKLEGLLLKDPGIDVEDKKKITLIKEKIKAEKEKAKLEKVVKKGKKVQEAIKL